MSEGININKTHAAAGDVYSWFSELDYHGVPEENKLTMEVLNYGVGHYTQAHHHLTWKRTRNSSRNTAERKRSGGPGVIVRGGVILPGRGGI
uniref:Cupin domain-containing protein n=1 Tax=Haemonchus contortus TaxID=6289 RepID=A0A7I4YUV5_HAECO